MSSDNGPIGLDDFHGLLSHHRILLTGSTGFVGKVILEKLFFELGPKAPHAYLLIRPSASRRTGPAAPDARLAHLLDSPVFDRCKEKFGKDEFLSFARALLTVVPGDLSRITKLNQPFRSVLLEPQPEGWTKHVTAFIHCAASLQFEESLVQALRQNTAAALAMHAGACDRELFPALTAYLHISTAYVQCDRFGTCAPVLPALSHLKMDDTELRALVERILETGEMPSILGGYPNTYTLSKAIAERLIAAQARALCGPPLVIVRPSIIGASVKEPVPGWVDSVNAIGGAMLFATLRIQREIAGIPIIRPDSVPVDRTVNAIIMALVAGVPKAEPGGSPFILHSSYWKDDYTWQHIADYVTTYSDYHVPAKAINAPPREFHFNPHKWLLAASVFFAYRVPLWALQLVHKVLPGNSSVASGARQLARLVKAIDQTSELFSHFTHNEWRLDTSTVDLMAASVDAKVLELYPVVNTDIEAKAYIMRFNQGVQRFLLQEPNPPEPDVLLPLRPQPADTTAANNDRIRSAKLMDALDSLLLVIPSLPYALWSAWHRIRGTRKLAPGLPGAGPFVWSAAGVIGLVLKLRWAAERRQRRLDLGDNPDNVDNLVVFQRNLMGLWLNPTSLLIWALLTTGQRFLDWRSTAAATILLRPVWARAAAFHAALAMLVVWLGSGRAAPPRGTRRTLAIALFLLGRPHPADRSGLRSRLLGVLTPSSMQFVRKSAPEMVRSASTVFL